MNLTLPSQSQDGLWITRRLAWWCYGLAGFQGFICSGLLFNTTPYQAQVYQIHRQVACMEVWGAAWAVSMTLWVAAGYTRSIRIWVPATIFSMFVCIVWLTCSIASWFKGYGITTVSFGLWGFAIFAQVMLLVAPKQIEII